MFDHVVLNRSIDGPALTIGEIAEALLFYQSVHIILDHSTLTSLLRKIGAHNVIKLLSFPNVKATYIEEFIGVHTEQTPFGQQHTLVSAYLSGGEHTGELKSIKKRLEYILLRNNLTKNQVENFFNRFRRLVTFKKVSDNHFIKGGIICAAMDDLSDKEYVSAGSRIVAKNLLDTETLPHDYRFDIIANTNTFQISTNLDFDKINTIKKLKSPTAGNYTPANIASELFSASYGLILAGHYGGDFYTSEISSDIIQVKNKQILNRTRINKKVQNEFFTIVLSGFPDIVTALNSGNRTFDEFCELLSKANRFKNWLKDKSPDENLISNYLQDVTSSGWINQTSVKIFRYIASTSLGLINPTAGLLVSAIDTFLLDKLNLGWKPNQFINSTLKNFVDDQHDN
ncbi:MULTISPECIES: hypothetical protein [unclassified Pseudocitrobacter]|uniref:hypothetical protein n=1 Tax=unclassified Pseudocitrobacter TaxID=2638778 RepID=UPI0023E35BB2|nr:MULTISPECIES: hypothetical protein [unclassified Pseudocitrobacter]MDF3827788.1 hypothetical protein [Pseudocitrobacter sp. 2023EL-00150]MEC5373665.1 hypothetical protein [Pseudocitrobacter sp. MW920760]